MTKNTADAAWTPFIRRSLEDYQQLPPPVRAEIADITRGRGRGARNPSREALDWWHRLPGLPQHNRIVFAAIKSGGQ